MKDDTSICFSILSQKLQTAEKILSSSGWSQNTTEKLARDTTLQPTAEPPLCAEFV